MNYEDVYPEQWKPPVIGTNEGKAILEALNPRYDVVLDSGAMRAVWELVEAEAKRKFPTRETLSGIRAMLRAVEAFRSAYYGTQEGFVTKVDPSVVPTNGAKKKRVFSSVPSPGKIDPPKKKRVFSK